MEFRKDLPLKDSLPSKWTCPLCLLLMNQPIQTARGQLACKSCFTKAKGSSNLCPIDHKPIAPSEIFSDIYAQRTISQLQTWCTYIHNDCNWEGTVGQLTNHANKCIHRTVICEECHQPLPHKELTQHQENLCPQRNIMCRYCANEIRAIDSQTHIDHCHFRPTACPHCQQTDITIDKLYEHIQKCFASHEPTICPFRSIGCMTSLHDTPVSTHISSHTHRHAVLVSASLNEAQRMMISAHSLLSQERQKTQTLTQQVHTHQEELAKQHQINLRQQQDVTELTRKISDLTLTSQKSKKELSDHISAIYLLLAPADAKPVTPQQMDKKCDELENRLRDLNIQTSTISTERMNERFDKLNSENSRIAVRVANLHIRQTLSDQSSRTGNLVWKIDRLAARIHTASSDNLPIHSAPCFTEQNGYKFRGRLYLNGDGLGRNTHLSLFFTLMKTEFDATLKWPFDHRVTFSLICPENRNLDKIEYLTPSASPNSACDRPTHQTNFALGFPLFLKRQDIHQYAMNDSIFIRIRMTPPHDTTPINPWAN